MTKKNLFILIIIFFIALGLRFYRLASFPAGFHIDEASLGYNGYSLLLTGKDENNKSFPLYIDMFGDNRPSGYHYLTILPIKFFGLTEFAVRFPGALFGSLTVLAIYFLAMAIFQEKKIALLSAFLIAISPWHLILSRASAEAIVSLLLIILGAFFLLRSWQNQRPFFVGFGSLFFSLSFFFYHTSRVFVPVLFLLLLAIMVKQGGRRYKISLIISFLIVSFLAFILVFFVSGGAARFTQVNIFGFPETKLVMEEQIREDGVMKTGIMLTRLFHNKITGYSLTFIKNYFGYFTGDFLFLEGGRPLWYSVPRMGLLYLVELPFLLLGLFFLAGQAKIITKLPLIWLAISPLTAALTVDDIPNINRALVMLPGIELIVACGIFIFFNKAPFRLQKVSFGLITVILLYNFFYFLHQYYIHGPIHNNWYRNEGFAQMLKTVKDSYGSVDKVVVTKGAGGIYPLILFYMQYDPRVYQAEGSPKDRDYTGFGKFFFVPQVCPFQQKDDRFPKNQKILYVERGDCPVGLPQEKIIYQKDGTKVFHLVYE